MKLHRGFLMWGGKKYLLAKGTVCWWWPRYIERLPKQETAKGNKSAISETAFSLELQRGASHGASQLAGFVNESVDNVLASQGTRLIDRQDHVQSTHAL